MWWKTGWICALLALAAPLGAQQAGVEELDLPRHVADDIIAFFNRPSTIRFQGRAEIPAGRSVAGDVAVLGGPLTMAGVIDGDLVVVNGSLTVPEGGRITGNVTVVGGEADVDIAAVGGQLVVYEGPLTYARRGDRIAYEESPWSRWEERRRHGRSWFSVRSAGNYNRVEGMPVMFGPVFRTRGDDAFLLDAMGIWKSESGVRLAPRELGYLFRAEQHFGPDSRFSVGGTAHSLVDPIHTNGLRDIEASLASFLLHRDYRDYFERQGFSGYVRYDEPDWGLHLTLEYRDDEHSFVPVGSPWTLKRNDAPWRPQPLVAEGRLRTLASNVLVDARNDQDDPTDGWYLEARATVGLGGGLTLPQYYPQAPQPATPVQEPRVVDTDFSTGLLDLRRYARLGPGADLRLRGYLAGSLGGGALPPQAQRTLGGEGSLPGHPLLSIDCGARDRLFSVFREVDEETLRMPVYAGYGCDRVALFQAEYRGDLFFDFDLGPGDNWDEGWDWYPAVNLHPSWSVFFNAGRGWSLADPLDPAWLGPSSSTLMDIGFGFLLGDVGLYWAWPLSGSNKDANFFLRIDHRF
jgi:hypothetical protein